MKVPPPGVPVPAPMPPSSSSGVAKPESPLDAECPSQEIPCWKPMGNPNKNPEKIPCDMVKSYPKADTSHNRMVSCRKTLKQSWTKARNARKRMGMGSGMVDLAPIYGNFDGETAGVLRQMWPALSTPDKYSIITSGVTKIVITCYDLFRTLPPPYWVLSVWVCLGPWSLYFHYIKILWFCCFESSKACMFSFLFFRMPKFEPYLTGFFYTWQYLSAPFAESPPSGTNPSTSSSIIDVCNNVSSLFLQQLAAAVSTIRSLVQVLMRNWSRRFWVWICLTMTVSPTKWPTWAMLAGWKGGGPTPGTVRSCW